MVRHFPGVEADPVLIIDLVVEEIATARISPVKPRRVRSIRARKGTAIAELGEFQRDKREVIDVGASSSGFSFACSFTPMACCAPEVRHGLSGSAPGRQSPRHRAGCVIADRHEAILGVSATLYQFGHAATAP